MVKNELKLIWHDIWVIVIELVVRFMVFNTTFNNISVISCQSVLLVEETGVPGTTVSSYLSFYKLLKH